MSVANENQESGGESTKTHEDRDNALLVRNITIAACLGLLGLFVAGVSLLTILLAANFNVLGWME